MPKEPETVDRFRVSAEIEPEHLGPVLAQLAKLGLQNIGYELITDVLTFNKKNSGGGLDLAREWIGQRQSFKLSELAAHFKTHGRGQSSAAGIVNRMTEAGELQSLGNGYYQRPLGLPAPQPQETRPEKVHASVGVARPRFETTGHDAVWRHIKNRKKPFSVAELKTLFRAQGRNDTSVSPIIDRMLKQKLLKRVEDGQYQLTGKQPKATGAPSASRARTSHNKRYDVSNRDLIMSHAKGRKTFTTGEVTELFKKEGRPSASATSMIATMKKEGTLKVVGDHEFEMVKNTSINGTGAEHANG